MFAKIKMKIMKKIPEKFREMWIFLEKIGKISCLKELEMISKMEINVKDFVHNTATVQEMRMTFPRYYMNINLTKYFI